MLTMARKPAHDNAWMNSNRCTPLGDVPEACRKGDLGLFFHSLHGTLNHLLLVDRLWLARMRGETCDIEGLEPVLYEKCARPRPQHKKSDRQLAEYVDAQSEAVLDSMVNRQSARTGKHPNFSQKPVPMQLFSHQSHCRGPVTAAMSRPGVDYGVTDLIFMLAETQVHG